MSWLSRALPRTPASRSQKCDLAQSLCDARRSDSRDEPPATRPSGREVDRHAAPRRVGSRPHRAPADHGDRHGPPAPSGTATRSTTVRATARRHTVREWRLTLKRPAPKLLRPRRREMPGHSWRQRVAQRGAIPGDVRNKRCSDRPINPCTFCRASAARQDTARDGKRH